MAINVVNQPIGDSLEQNFMPYAMSVIVSRAIPEIDGFKPSHRKLLYTMFKMGLMGARRSKSSDVVGQTMQLNPHGDQAIYDTMVRLTRGNEALLHPFVDSKGNFGKAYSRDMSAAASRYTEVKLDAICAEIFTGIDKNAVDFAPNYNGSTTEPTLLPTGFPNLLVSANTGIAVGMASNICGFNLREVCESTIARIKNPEADLFQTLKAPDFPTGGEVIYDARALEEIYKTGRGSIKLRAKYSYDKKNNCIDVTEIPYTTTVEAIIDKLAENIKNGKIKEISDVRDETDLKGLKITIDLKRGVDADRLMQRLFKMTPLMDSFACNFNILIAGTPRVMGVGEILDEWTAWRAECIKRELYHEMNGLKDRLHLLRGLNKILLDIDRAIKIIRETDEESEVIPNLMIGFGIDKIQAEFIAEIRLRHLNREYILRRVSETESIEKRIAELEETIKSKTRVLSIIVSQLERIISKYGAERKTEIVYSEDIEPFVEEEHIEDYAVNLFLSEDGYFKKITPLSLRMGGEQRFKEGDKLRLAIEGNNRDELLFFTDSQDCYKVRAHEFEDSKASVLGDYLPTKLGMDSGSIVFMARPGDYSSSLLFVYANGKGARVELSCYDTKSNRRRLTGAYSDKSPLVAVYHITEETEIVLYSSTGRALIVNTASLSPKTTRTAQGVNMMTLKVRDSVARSEYLEASSISDRSRYKTRNIPAAGAVLKEQDRGEVQLEL